MKLSLNWLKRYVALTQDPAEIERALTMIGFEVEGVERTGLADLPNVVVGEVAAREQHPNADRLSVCKVDVGGEELLNIVCGAKNFKVGDRVPVAVIGAELPGGFKIKRSKLRGVESEGMMCSARELGLGDDHEGLLILETRPAIGERINDVFPGGDVVFDLEVTPNRPDCLSHIGVARELAAYFNLELRYPEVKANTGGPFQTRLAPLVKQIRVKTPDNCLHYRGYSIRGVKVAPSPDWLQSLLRSVGLRPINNVVDVTNFVLLELGQPLHAFDASKIKGEEIIVRMARSDESITTLDGKERRLNESMMVIADTERPLVVAGVMGSIDAEVDDTTTDILLESAYFAPTTIRKTSRQLALSTDSSYRFERGVDPAGAEFAALRAIDLLLETAGGELCGPAIVEGAPPFSEREITLEADYVRRVLGFDITNEDLVSILERLELGVQSYQGESGLEMRVSVPSHRLDLERPIDLVEECLRIYGTEKIPFAPVNSNALVAEDALIAQFVRRSAEHLAANGFCECVNYPMRPEGEVQQLFGEDLAKKLALANPLTADQSHLRPSILPGLLDTLRLNLARGTNPRALFETGRIFREVDGSIQELVSVAFVLYGVDEAQWRVTATPDFYKASGVALDLLALAGVKATERELEAATGGTLWQEGHSAGLGGARRGYEVRCGLLDMTMTQRADVDGPVYAGEVWITAELLERRSKRRSFAPMSSYPAATRDIALLVEESKTAGEIQSFLEKSSRKVLSGREFTLEGVELFDLYRGKGIPEGEKSLAFTISFRSHQRTLTDKEVNEAFVEIQETLTEAGFTVRS